jgi:hypothetical protein
MSDRSGAAHRTRFSAADFCQTLASVIRAGALEATAGLAGCFKDG